MIFLSSLLLSFTKYATLVGWHMLPQPFISKSIIATSWKEGCCPLDEKNYKKKVTQKTLQQSPLTHALKGFFRQSTVTMVFTHWPREDSFPLSKALGGTCWHLNHFCNILLQDLTPLHVKITRSTNLLSVCRGRLKLSTYLHTVSYNHISFLNTHSQLLWVLTSSEFYSTTWRMISRSAGYKIHFWKKPPRRGNFFPLSVWYLSFFWIFVFTQSNK